MEGYLRDDFHMISMLMRVGIAFDILVIHITSYAINGFGFYPSLRPTIGMREAKIEILISLGGDLS